MNMADASGLTAQHAVLVRKRQEIETALTFTTGGADHRIEFTMIRVDERGTEQRFTIRIEQLEADAVALLNEELSEVNAAIATIETAFAGL